jgi:hypothetical protein
VPRHVTRRPEGTVTRGTTAPNRLRRVDRWLVATQADRLRIADAPPLVVDLGFGASPVTTVELYERLRPVRPDVEVIGLEIDPAGWNSGEVPNGGRQAGRHPGLTFAVGGFELRSRDPDPHKSLQCAPTVRRRRGRLAWDRLCAVCHLTCVGGGTCDEIGRRAVWVTLRKTSDCETAAPLDDGPRRERPRGTPHRHLRRAGVESCAPFGAGRTVPKTLIHHNVPASRPRFPDGLRPRMGDRCPQSVFGPRQRWVAAVEDLSLTWPVSTRPPLGGRARWRLGELTLPWKAVAPNVVTQRSL